MAKAKAKLSEMVNEAEKSGPQALSRSGREVAMIVSIKEWKRLSSPELDSTEPKQSMAQFFLNSPLNGSGIEIERVKLRPREFNL